jgi:hypothetical protein
MGVPAWRSLPSWFLVADGDQAIPPEAERGFAKRMGAMVSHPDDVLSLIRKAAQGVPTAR